MPLLETIASFQTQNLLEAAGLPSREQDKDLKTLLHESNIDTADLLDIVSSIARGGDTDAIRLRAAELGLKLNGVLQETNQKEIPTVNIIIRDTANIEVNPILIPRTI